MSTESEKNEGVPKILNLPQRIHLCFGLEKWDDDFDFADPMAGSGDSITWCEDQIGDYDPAYVLESVVADWQARALRAEEQNRLLKVALSPCLKKDWFAKDHIIGDVVVSLNAKDAREALSERGGV